MKCDGTCAETKLRLPAKRTSPFKSAGASVQSTTGSRGVRTSGSNAGYTMFRGSVKTTGYPLHSPVSPSLPLPCLTVCHHISTGLYKQQSLPVIYRNTVSPLASKALEEFESSSYQKKTHFSRNKRHSEFCSCFPQGPTTEGGTAFP